EIDLERSEPPDDVLRRVGSIDPEDELLGALRCELAPGLEHLGALREVFELSRIDGDRRGGDGYPAPFVAERVHGPVRGGAHDVFGGTHEVPPPSTGVEADDIVRQ